MAEGGTRGGRQDGDEDEGVGRGRGRGGERQSRLGMYKQKKARVD